MDFADFSKWMGALALVVTVINTVWLMAGRATKPVSDKLASHSKDLVDHDRRIQKLEGDYAHMPTRKEVNDLLITTTALGGNINRLDDAVISLTHTVRRIDDYLREEKP